MKLFQAMIRVIAQLILVGPIIRLFPWALLLGIGTIVFALEGEAREPAKVIAYGFGWLGLIGLCGSILIPVGVFRSVRWARWLITFLLICGFVSTAAFLLPREDPDSTFTKWNWWTAWELGGPVLVACWNIWRVYKQPNPESSIP